jgi:hypothetical protein
MTMQHTTHPDDERLAALAGGDADATADAGLRAHVSACDRCAPMVDDLRQLRTALAELPDLVPSMPLQLVPPVPGLARREAASGGWLRRLAGPVMAAGAGLVLVGAVGASGVMNGFSVGMGSAAAPSAADQAEQSGEGEAAGLPTSAPRAPSSIRDRAGYLAGKTPAPSSRLSLGDTGSTASENAQKTAVPAGRASDSSAGSVSISPWGLLLLAGAVLLFAGGTILVAKRPGAP